MKPDASSSSVSPQTVRQIAAEAGSDPKTVRRVIEGLPTKQTPRERIEAAMRKLGFEALLTREAG